MLRWAPAAAITEIRAGDAVADRRRRSGRAGADGAPPDGRRSTRRPASRACASRCTTARCRRASATPTCARSIVGGDAILCAARVEAARRARARSGRPRSSASSSSSGRRCGERRRSPRRAATSASTSRRRARRARRLDAPLSSRVMSAEPLPRGMSITATRRAALRLAMPPLRCWILADLSRSPPPTRTCAGRVLAAAGPRALTDYIPSSRRRLNAVLYAASRAQIPTAPSSTRGSSRRWMSCASNWRLIRDEALALSGSGHIRAAAAYNGIGFNSFCRSPAGHTLLPEAGTARNCRRRGQLCPRTGQSCSPGTSGRSRRRCSRRCLQVVAWCAIAIPATPGSRCAITSG